MKIPITMSHGTDQILGKRNPLTQEHFAHGSSQLPANWVSSPSATTT